MTLRSVEPGTYSVLSEENIGAAYDRRAAGYDLVVGSKLYSRFVWDAAPADYAAFISDAFVSRPGGAVLDIAAGSGLESAATYAATGRHTVVLDRSLGMLRRGRERVSALCDRAPAHVAYLQADALALPFRNDSFSTVLSHGALHLFDDVEASGREWFRVLAPGGSLRVSSLALAGRRGDRWMAMLHRAGEIAGPRSPESIASGLQAGTGHRPKLSCRGNFAFLSVDAP